MKDEEHPLDPQLEKAERIAYLIAGFINHTLTPAEHDELDNWVEASPENMQLFEDLTDEQKSAEELQQFRQADTAAGLKRLHQKIRDEAKSIRSPRHFSRQLLIMSAAAIVLAAVSVVLFVTSKKSTTVPPTAAAASGTTPAYKAFLRTAAGDTISLDEATDGNLAVQGNTQVVKSGNLLSYHRTGQVGISERTVLNTLSTRRGGQYSLLLPDGSKVWLNAASSLSFPSAFTGRERKVVLSGAAYFEIARDGSRPFQVWIGDILIEALGTRFSVDAYGDEAIVSAALVEGSIRIVQGSMSKLLRPGEEAQVQQGHINVRTANLAKATGWRNGQLVFRNTLVSTVANELSRWYDTNISYRGHNNTHISITIDRGMPLEKVIHLLEGTGSVHFTQVGTGGWEIR